MRCFIGFAMGAVFAALMFAAATSYAGSGSNGPFYGASGGGGVDPASDLELNVGSKLVFDADDGSDNYIYTFASGNHQYHSTGQHTFYINGSSKLTIQSAFAQLYANMALRFGSTPNYWQLYNTTGTQFELWSTNVDGGGADGLVMSVADGTDDVTFGGDLVLPNAEYISNSTDGTITFQEAGGATDSKSISFALDGTNGNLIVTPSETTLYFNSFTESNGGHTIGATRYFTINGRSRLASPADGQWTLVNNAISSGITLDVDDAADTVVIKDQAGTGAGNLALDAGGKALFDGASGNDYISSSGNNLLFYVTGGNTAIMDASGLILRDNKHLGFGASSPDQTLTYADGTGVTWNDGTNTVLTVADDANSMTIGALAALSGGAILPVQTAATPSEPATCDAASKGRIEVVDDNDDTAATEVCYCGMTDDTTYDWLNIADNTACSFY